MVVTRASAMVCGRVAPQFGAAPGRVTAHSRWADHQLCALSRSEPDRAVA